MTSKENQLFYRHVRDISCAIVAGGYGLGMAAETVLTLWSKTQCPSLCCTGLAFSKKLAAYLSVCLHQADRHPLGRPPGILARQDRGMNYPSTVYAIFNLLAMKEGGNVRYWII